MSALLRPINIIRLNLITTFSIFSTVALAIYCLLKLNRFTLYYWIVIYCIINASVEIIAFTFAIKGLNNILFYYVLIFIEFFTIVQFLYTSSEVFSNIKKIYLLIFAYTLLLIIFFIFDSTEHFSPYSGMFEAFMVFLFCLLYFVNQIKNPMFKNIVKVPMFWIISAFLIYYGCSWLILLGTQLLPIKQELFIYIWEGQNILNIIKNILIFVGFLWIQ